MGTEWCVHYSTGPQYQGVANTIVQLILRAACGLVPLTQEADARALEPTIKERMAKTCRKRLGNRTRNTDG